MQKDDTIIVSSLTIQYGAGNENRTRIFAMARRHISRCTIPAQCIIIISQFIYKSKHYLIKNYFIMLYYNTNETSLNKT